MFTLDTNASNASSILPAPKAPGTNVFFQDDSNPGTQVPADLLNMIMLELNNAVLAAGLTPTKTIYNQLAQAIRILGGSGLVLNVLTFTTAGAFDFAIPANALTLGSLILTGGGGGAGGTGTGVCGGGGGAAATAMGAVALTPGGGLTGLIGIGGAGAAPGANGTPGGQSTCAGFIAGPGLGGEGGTPFVAGGGPGSASGAALNISGGYGIDGINTGNVAPWAHGGASFWGGGGRAGDGGGVAGEAPGSGGGAGYGSSCSGGPGAPGVAFLQFWTYA